MSEVLLFLPEKEGRPKRHPQRTSARLCLALQHGWFLFDTDIGL